MNKVLFISIVVFLLNACSYEPMLSSKNYDFQFSKISFVGDKSINKNIQNNLTKKNLGEREFEIFYSSSKIKEIVSSNEKGDPTIFKLSINLTYSLFEDGNKILSNKILKDSTYNNINDKFELSKYEENIIENLTTSISSEILMTIASLSK